MASQALLFAFLLNPMLATAFPLSRYVTRVLNAHPSVKSYTVQAWDDAKGTWKTKSYPVLNQSTCPTEGPDVGKGICKDSCMAPYMTPKTLPLIFKAVDGDQFNSTLNWTLPHWGDRDGLHVPQNSLLAEFVKSDDLPELLQFMSDHKEPASFGTPTMTPPPTLRGSYDTVQPTRSYGTVQPTTTDAMAAYSAFKPVPVPTPGSNVVILVPCVPVPSDRRHTPLVTAHVHPNNATQTTTATLVPQNPVCDEDDPIGWTDEEKLWLYQNEEPSFWSRKSFNGEHIECYNYESCWDHCQAVHKRALITKWAVLGLVMLIIVLILISCLICAFRRCRSKREIKGKREDEEVIPSANKKKRVKPLPVILESPQQFDGPADDKHSVVTTGRESLCSDEGVAKRF